MHTSSHDRFYFPPGPNRLRVRRGRSRTAAESVCLWSGYEPKPVLTDEIHSTHGTQSPRAHETASSIVCRIQVHMAAGSSTRNRATMEKSYFLFKLEACAGQRVTTLFERLDWKTPCLMYTLANPLRSPHKDTWAFYASVDGLSLGPIKRRHY